jgi:hypothetical protein
MASPIRRVHRRRALVALFLVCAAAGTLPATTLGAADTTPPSVTAPKATVRLWGNLGRHSIPFKASWAGTDPAGIAAYRLQLRTDGGAWSTVPLGRPAAVNARLRLEPGHDYQLRVRATDGAGNRSPYATSAAFHVRRFSEVAPATSSTGPWTRRANDGFIGGHALISGAADSAFSFTFTGTEIAWITTTGPGRGSASVFLDDTFKTMTNTTRPTTKHRRVAYRFAWPTSGEHVLRLAAADNPDVDGHVTEVDAMIVVEPATGDPAAAGH